MCSPYDTAVIAKTLEFGDPLDVRDTNVTAVTDGTGPFCAKARIPLLF